MKKTRLNRLISLVLVAMIMIPGSLRVTAAEAVSGPGYEEGTGTDENEEAFSLNDNLLEPVASGDASLIHKPRKNTDSGETVTTWDCIWFGNYWQEDTNGDGYCFEKETVVSKNGDGNLVDQDGKRIYDTIPEGTYYADRKQPIKWRVLDIDADGNALLLADKLIDAVRYNETHTNVTWETCTMRSYLNGYDGSKNVCSKNFSEQSGNRSFVYSVFNDDEIKCLIESEVKNPNNPVYETAGGNTTYDRLFCLSFEEAMNGDYGFIKNEFTIPSEEEEQFYTDDDPSRVAVKTKFTGDKPGHDGTAAGTSDQWWLRSPGHLSNNASLVNPYGASSVFSTSVAAKGICVRPAFRMNLSSSSSLWVYAGTVSSDGTVNTAVDNVKGPQTMNSGVSTWDCIWFGKYWQEDTNGDGYCCEKETVVSKNGDGDRVDQDGKIIYDTIPEGTYEADSKQPIKWRVLDIDDNGNALLLADKLIDIVPYNETDTDVTWETCTMRSYLNGYDGSNNVCNKDFSIYSDNRSFLYSAFYDDEIKCLIESEVKNPNNPVWGTKGGNTTSDRLFCLSLDEAMNGDYGFIKNEFTNPSSSEKKYYTDADPTRVAVTTKFTYDKPGYYVTVAGTSGLWWLRSPGIYVDTDGAAHADSTGVDNNDICARPAFRMNLSSSSSLWSYAGTVSSDGTVNQAGVAVQGVKLTKQRIIKKDSKSTLVPEITPSDAFDKTVIWEVSVGGETIISVDENGVVTGLKEGTATVVAKTHDGGYEDSCIITVVGSDGIASPSINKGISIWDCIWFGNYWQEDTNGDGYCFEKETVVSKNGDGNLVDQDGKRIYDTIPEGTYYADDRQPIKWRVLDIDGSGNVLLLADKLIDIAKYNEIWTDVTWETCTMRSYLNGYGNIQNVCNESFSGDKSFLYNAFSETERNNIITSDLTNPKNPVYGTTGGNDTQDKIFCLSLAETMNLDYGFIKNEFTRGDSTLSYTNDDPTCVAVTTKFTDDKLGYRGNAAETPDWWWLRSPGINSRHASYVSITGAAYADGDSVNYYYYCVRPAFRMNLSSSSSLWTYAGTVSSDGTVVEPVAVTGVTMQKTASVDVGKTITLIPEISPSNATNNAVTWKSGDDSIATVNTNGVVTGVKAGQAGITVTTKDRGFTATCTVTVEESTDPKPFPVSNIQKPSTQNGISTWDCIWFGNYWQDDTNGDGEYLAKNSEWDGVIHYADAKTPIKWRVLDIDSSGNALLLSDKLLDYVLYDRNNGTSITWESCSLRSYLNSDGKSTFEYPFFTPDGFKDNAFSSVEKNAITVKTIQNPDNPIDGSEGGNPTNDALFCLSIPEAMNPEYGFIKNEFSQQDSRKTDEDQTRRAYKTPFLADRLKNSGYLADNPQSWWLRSPGIKDSRGQSTASSVGFEGEVYAFNYPVNAYGVGLRPAFYMNLDTASPLWTYAGTVSSDGTVNEEGTVRVKGVSLPKQKSIKTGETITLTPEIEPSNATDKTVTWSSSNASIASVDKGGTVTGNKAGNAVITAKTNDGGFTATCAITVEKTVKIQSFKLFVDNNHFSNSWKDLFNEGEVRNYQFKNEGYYKKLKALTNNYDLGSLNSMVNREWFGSCYGIAATMGLVKLGRLSVRDMTSSGAQNYHSLKAPRKDNMVFDGINFYQAGQLIDKMYYNTQISSTRKDGFRSANDLSTFLERLVESTDEGNPVLFSYGYENSGHAILALDSRYDEGRGKYIVTMYDENTAKGYDGYEPEHTLEFIINNDYSSFTYTTASEKRLEEIWKYMTIRDLTKFPLFTESSYQGYGISSVSALDSDSAWISLPLGSDISVTNSEGKELNYKDGVVSGSMPVRDVRDVVADEASEIVVQLDRSDRYSIEAPSGLDVDLYSVEHTYSLKGEDIDSVDISMGDASMDVHGTGYDFEAAISPQGSDVFTVLKAKAEGDVKISEKDDSLVAESGNAISDVVAQSFDGSTISEKEVKISGNTIAVPYASKNRTIVAKQKIDLAGNDFFGKTYGKYMVSDKKLASVNSRGILTAKKAGRIKITGLVKSGNQWVEDGENAISIIIEQPYVGSKSIEKRALYATADATENLSGSKASPTEWISSKPGIATVDSLTGMIKVCGKGSTKITAVYGTGKQAARYSFTFKANIPVLNRKKASMMTGGSLKLKLNNCSASPAWSSSDDSKAVVTDGKVTALSCGQVTISATVDGVDYTCDIDIKAPAIKKASINLGVGKTAKVGLKNTKLKDIGWISSNTSVATVDENGVVKGVSSGIAVISTTAGGVESSCTVNVR